MPALPLALTMGEPAGVGGELACLAWCRRNEGLPPFFLIDDADRIAALGRRVGLDVAVQAIDAPEAATAAWPDALPVLHRPLSREVVPGQPNSINADRVVGAIDEAAALALAGRVAGIVTNPIQKSVLYAAGFKLPGHTEYLAEITGAATAPVMMLAVPGLRVALVTIHLSLADAVGALDTSSIVATARCVADALRSDFGIPQPRLAVAGLNPHAGEAGALGREEIDIIAPAIEALRADAVDAFGPLPADTMFHADARRRYDAAICMYHDQALIPLKTIDFWRGVNVTLGLPIVRTSPDHGTALDLAGTGKANPESLIAALGAARDIAAHRAAAGAKPTAPVAAARA